MHLTFLPRAYKNFGFIILFTGLLFFNGFVIRTTSYHLIASARITNTMSDLDQELRHRDTTYVPSDSDSESGWSSGDEFGGNIARHVTMRDNLLQLVDGVVPGPAHQGWLLRHEVPRKVFHSLVGFFVLALYAAGAEVHQVVAPLWVLFALTFANDVVRLNFPAANKHVVQYVSFLIRELEVNSWNGIVFYLAGAALVVLFAQKDIAVISIVLLSWADTAALTVGRAYGKYTPAVAPGKSLAGCLASAATGYVVCWLFYAWFVPRYSHVSDPAVLAWSRELSRMPLPVYALATALITLVAEAVDVGLDDNFTIPVICLVCLLVLVRATSV